MAEPEKAVEISKEAAKKKPLSLDDNPGASASTGSYAGTAMSMIGWGLAIMAVVTLVVIFVKSEDATSPTP